MGQENQFGSLGSKHHSPHIMRGHPHREAPPAPSKKTHLGRCWQGLAPGSRKAAQCRAGRLSCYTLPAWPARARRPAASIVALATRPKGSESFQVTRGAAPGEGNQNSQPGPSLPPGPSSKPAQAPPRHRLSVPLQRSMVAHTIGDTAWVCTALVVRTRRDQLS